jgi:hypothetical protein
LHWRDAEEVLMHSFDIELTAQDLQGLHNSDAVTALFTRLGYDTAGRTMQTPSNLGIPEGVARPIKRIELIADHQKLFQIYLFELKSVTVAEIKALARVFRNFAGQFLLVLTSNFEYIDFVLLDRELKGHAAPTAMTAVQPTMVQRRFSVDRRRPTVVHLRVLRRFTWTETDPFAQFDKLRYAYDLAHWSEVYFNNRGLFSDYYLTDRLRPIDGGSLEFPEWGEDPKPAYQRLRGVYDQASQRFASKNTSELMGLLYKPLLNDLGFEISLKPDRGSGVHLRLVDPESAELLGLCLPYPWGRELDRKDDTHDTETPQITPAFAVVDLLAKEEAPWVILTNGKLWRLYSKRSHSRATNYYEIDLDEVLGRQGFQQDIQDSFRYFWLLFRMKAFRPAEVEWQGTSRSLSMLDRLLLGSEAYAKELGENLKGRVFTDAFPVLAEGFIAQMRERAGGALNLDQDRLDNIFQGTLTLLYRLLFLLYAESRDLLPVHSREYREASLQRLKDEIKDAAGAIEDETEQHLNKRFQNDVYGLWQKLQSLFRVIDKGSEELNIPRYNGGLFLAERAEDDHSPEAQAARFLAREQISDRYLARAIDLLARGIDPKRQDLVSVDYKSLGVRQLGSIYEGLLEFSLRIANQKLGIVKDKGREVYKPFTKLNDHEQKRAESKKAYVSRGRAFLENDKRERKATGSYYTPDHIVKYIVENALGPVLQAKFDGLRPKLREAQRERREFFKQQEDFTKRGMKPKPPEQADLIGKGLFDELFDIKVLDPAMGSGHFLVEAVDFITDKTLEFLNAFPWNPVLVHLDQMRKIIQEQMDEQNIDIDANRLTDVNLLKRHVLKRCIYGVDLNPMAVELAKVSLWLDCFTLGAPLSFLDHHLRWGNSLIGCTIAEVDAIREAKGQLALTGTSDWQGLTQAVQTMIDVGGMADITPDQVASSRRHYESALSGVEVFKRVLDLHTARWFAQVPASTGKQKKNQVNIFDEMLRSGELFAWAHERVASPVSHTAMAKSGQQSVVHAAAVADEKKFFHWELEFPEVFYGRQPGTLSAVARLENAGFDAVVGNPPYDELSEHALGRELDEADYFTHASEYRGLTTGRQNWYHFFIKRAVGLTHASGAHAFIVPMSLLGDQFTRPLRKWLITSGRFAKIEAFPQKDDPTRRVFFDAKLPTCIYVIRRGSTSEVFQMRTHPANLIDSNSPFYQPDIPALYSIDPENLPIPMLSGAGWSILRRLATDPKIGNLRDCGAAPTSGEIVFNEQFRRYLTDEPNGTLILRGSHVQRWEIVEEAKQGEPVYLKSEAYLKDAKPGSKAFHYKQPRVVYQECAAIDNWRRVIAAYLPAGHFCGHKICYFTDYRCSPAALLAVFNSKLIDWVVTALSTNNSLPAYLIGSLPFPKFFESTTLESNAFKEIRGLFEREVESDPDFPGLLQRIREVDERYSLRTIHDVLAFLAEAMIQLNTAKQECARDLLAWILRHTKISANAEEAGIDLLNGKSLLKNFIGDYQHDTEHATYEQVLDILRKNSRIINVRLDAKFTEALRVKYDEVLGRALPIKARLARIDRLIDSLVYQAYGISQEEVNVVESGNAKTT